MAIPLHDRYPRHQGQEPRHIIVPQLTSPRASRRAPRIEECGHIRSDQIVSCRANKRICTPFDHIPSATNDEHLLYSQFGDRKLRKTSLSRKGGWPMIAWRKRWIRRLLLVRCEASKLRRYACGKGGNSTGKERSHMAHPAPSSNQEEARSDRWAWERGRGQGKERGNQT